MLAESPLAAAIRDLAERLKTRRATPEPPSECSPEPEPPTSAAVSSTPPSCWPPSLPALGPRHVIAFSPCADCQSDPPEDEVLTVGAYKIAVPGPQGTWISYGSRALCSRHARARAGEASR
jgi:hypothetical protein